MRPPGFWGRPQNSPGWQARLLAPLAAVYGLATATRLANATGYRAKVPVICLGNINVGGTGKTPATIALAEHLKGLGHAPQIVSRGYGGALKGPVLVDERTHTAADTGDEPLLLSAFAPTWVARDRAAGVRAAQQAGAGVILLDDGFQNPAVIKDLSIVVVDALTGFGNGRVMPAGPLREPVQTGCLRADLVLSVGDPTAQKTFQETWGGSVSCPHATAHLATLRTGMDWKGQDLLAFAGIGNPSRFFATLRSLGANLVRSEALDDHQPLTDRLMRRLEHEATALNAQLVTTEKDAVRLPPEFRTRVLTVPVRMVFDEIAPIDAGLAELGIGPKPVEPASG